MKASIIQFVLALLGIVYFADGNIPVSATYTAAAFAVWALRNNSDRGGYA